MGPCTIPAPPSERPVHPFQPPGLWHLCHSFGAETISRTPPLSRPIPKRPGPPPRSWHFWPRSILYEPVHNTSSRKPLPNRPSLTKCQKKPPLSPLKPPPPHPPGPPPQLSTLNPQPLPPTPASSSAGCRS